MGKALTVYPFRKAFEKAGASRISDEALKELSDTVENIGLQILLDAKEFAAHAGRKTIRKQDIKKASEIFLKLV